RDAAGTGAAVVLEVGAADLDQRHGAAPEEDRVAVVLEDVHPSREAFEVALEGLAVRVIRRAGGVVERVRVAALAGCELGRDARSGAHGCGGYQRVVVGEVEDPDVAAERLGHRVADEQRLVARRERPAAIAGTPAAAEGVEAPEVGGGGSGERRA